MKRECRMYYVKASLAGVSLACPYTICRLDNVRHSDDVVIAEGNIVL